MLSQPYHPTDNEVSDALLTNLDVLQVEISTWSRAGRLTGCLGQSCNSWLISGPQQLLLYFIFIFIYVHIYA